MDRCSYCRRNRVGYQKHIVHSIGCPQVIPAAESVWRAGWNDGRKGKLEPESSDPTYIMGFYQGVCALEEAENGFDPCVG